jgi:hypothetical protein
VLSGLLLDDAGPARAAYQAAGFQLVSERQEGEWASLVLMAAAPATRTGLA